MRFSRALPRCLAMILAAGPMAAQAPAAAAAPAWKPFNLGTHHRAVSTTSPAAQLAFDQGLLWAFAFNHDEAMRAFGEAAKQDPGLAAAWWGMALVNGPHINNPVVDEAHAKAARSALQAGGWDGGRSRKDRSCSGASTCCTVTKTCSRTRAASTRTASLAEDQAVPGRSVGWLPGL